MEIQIAPSILSADFCNLERDLEKISNADMVHVDVMDHHFVPNLTIGEPVVKRICEVTDLPVDVHLMIEDPDRWAPGYAERGAHSVTFHMGATHAPVRLARQLHDMGWGACFALRPAEPVEPELPEESPAPQQETAEAQSARGSNIPYYVGAGMAVLVFIGVTIFCKIKGRN